MYNAANQTDINLTWPMLNSILKIVFCRSVSIKCVMALVTISVFLPSHSQAQMVEWTAQIGTGNDEFLGSITTDASGNVYLVGDTEGAFSGNSTFDGRVDAVLIKYDSSGQLSWASQLSGDGIVTAADSSVDGMGNIYSVGRSTVDFGSGNSVTDAYLSKYDSGGILQWAKSLETGGGRATGVVADELGNTFVSGATLGDFGGTNAGSNDIFVAKYDSAGTEFWVQQIGSSGSDFSNEMVLDQEGNLLVAGYTTGDLEGSNAGIRDGFITKFDSNGNEEWTRQVGTTSTDMIFDIASDDFGNAYVTGRTGGELFGASAGNDDIILAKYDPMGTLEWSKQFGSAEHDFGDGISTDASGNILVSGEIDSELFVMSFDPLGNVNWTKILEANGVGGPFTTDVTLDGSGNIYVAADVFGDFYGNSAGQLDFAIAKFGAVPEPSSSILLLTSVLGLSLRRRRKAMSF